MTEYLACSLTSSSCCTVPLLHSTPYALSSFVCYSDRMSISVPCPKCGSRSTHIAVGRALYIGHPPDQIFSCTTCGKRVYGEAAVLALIGAEQAKVSAARQAAEETARRLREEQEAALQKKCAWPECEKEHTPTSKYCSRTCSDKNAHARAKERKAAAAFSAVPAASWT